MLKFAAIPLSKVSGLCTLLKLVVLSVLIRGISLEPESLDLLRFRDLSCGSETGSSVVEGVPFLVFGG